MKRIMDYLKNNILQVVNIGQALYFVSAFCYFTVYGTTNEFLLSASNLIFSVYILIRERNE